MAGQKGRDVLIQISNGATPEGFVTVAGVRAKTISLNTRLVDATTADSEAAWRELLAGAGVRTCSVSGAGVFKDAASDTLLREAFFAQATPRIRLIVPDFGTLEGAFVIERLDYAGEHDGEASFALALASAGPLTFAEL